MNAVGCILFILLTLSHPSYSILNGENAQWNRYGYLVKVFAREDGEESVPVTGCTGSIISGSLVLTSSQCLLNATTGLQFSQVVVTIANLKRPKTVPAEILEITKTWGLLRISKLTTEMLCPPKPAPPRVAQLNVRLSLLKSSVGLIDLKTLNKKRCSLTAFASSLDASDFVHQDEARQLNLGEIVQSQDDPNVFTATFSGNRTACWDDAGAALMCHLKEYGYLQVGFFQQLAFPSDETDAIEKSVESCTRALEMRFMVIIRDDNLFQAIEKYDLPAFVDIYRACRFQ